MYNNLVQDKVFNLLKDVCVKGDEIQDKYIDVILNKDYQNGYNLSLLQQSFVGDDKNLPLNKDDFIDMLTDIKTVGGITSEGYALITGYKHLKDIFIIKTAKDKKTEFNILYEYFVGVMGTNKLRNIIPNFSCILGLFKQYPPIITDKKVSFDKTKDKQYYVIYEKINGLSLNKTLVEISKQKYIDKTVNLSFKKEEKVESDKYIEKLVKNKKPFKKNYNKDGSITLSYIESVKKDMDMVFSYFLQIALVLCISQEHINFVHYDLHSDNIILRDLPKPIQIEYKYGGKKYKITTDKIPTFIDYGFVHFNIKNDSFGMVTIPSLNLFSSITNQSYDLYKLLMYSCLTLKDKKLIELVFSFYNLDYSDEKNVIELLKKNYTTFFALPKDFKDNYPPHKFVNHFFNHIKNTNMDIQIDEDFIPVDKSSSNFKNKIEYIGEKDEYSKCVIKNYKSVVINNYMINQMEDALKIVPNDSLYNHISIIKDITNKNYEEYHKNDLNRIEKYNYNLSKMDIISCEDIYKQIELLKNKEYKLFIDIEPTINTIDNLIEEYENYIYFVSYSQYTNPLKISQQLHKQYISLKMVSEYYYTTKNNILNFTLQKSMNDIVDKSDINKYSLSLRNCVFAFENIKGIYTKTEHNIYKTILDLNMSKNICLYVPTKSRLQITQVWNSKSRYLLNKLLMKSFNFGNINVETYINECLLNKMNDEDILIDLRKYNKEVDRKGRTENRIETLSKLFSDNKTIITPDFKYLDIGCTDGEIAYTFGKSLDLDKQQIFGADVGNWEDVGQKQVNSGITYINIPKQGRLPFDDNSFDVITVLMVLHHIEYVDERLKEIFRILKPNGKLIIREHDCISDTNRMIHDIEHSIYEISKKDTIDKTYLDTYNAWYRSRDVWNKKLTNIGFSLVSSDGNTPNSATRGYYELYTKQTTPDLVVEPYNIKWTKGILENDFPRAPYFTDDKAHPIGLKYTGLKNNKPCSNHWGQRKLLLSEIDFLTRLSKTHYHIVVYAGAADGKHIKILVDMFQNVEFHLYDPREFHKILNNQPRIKINPYYKDKTVKDYGFFTDDVATYYSNQPNVVFISDIRTLPTEEEIEINQRQQEKWLYIMKPIISMLKFKAPYPKYDNGDIYTYLDGEIRLQCWAPATSAETRLIVLPPFKNKIIDSYKYEQNLSWYNLVLRNNDFSNDMLNKFDIPLSMTVKDFWKRYISEDINFGFDFVYELKIITNYLNKYSLNVNYNEYTRLIDYINISLIDKNRKFISYLNSKGRGKSKSNSN